MFHDIIADVVIQTEIIS